jgi:hypothetical protein
MIGPRDSSIAEPYEIGSLVEKCHSESGDAHGDGSRAHVVEVLGPVEVPGHRSHYGYFVLWDDFSVPEYHLRKGTPMANRHKESQEEKFSQSAAQHAADIVRAIVAAVDNNGELEPSKERELIASIASSLLGWSKRMAPGKYVSCEGCSVRGLVRGGEVIPEGWSQCGESRFARTEIGNWCPSCTATEKNAKSEGGSHSVRN